MMDRRPAALHSKAASNKEALCARFRARGRSPLAMARAACAENVRASSKRLPVVGGKRCGIQAGDTLLDVLLHLYDLAAEFRFLGGTFTWFEGGNFRGRSFGVFRRGGFIGLGGVFRCAPGASRGAGPWALLRSEAARPLPVRARAEVLVPRSPEPAAPQRPTSSPEPLPGLSPERTRPCFWWLGVWDSRRTKAIGRKPR